MITTLPSEQTGWVTIPAGPEQFKHFNLENSVMYY